MHLTIEYAQGFDTLQPDEAVRARPSELARSLHEAALNSSSLRAWFARAAASIQPVVEQRHGMIAALVKVEAQGSAVQQLVFVGEPEASCGFTDAAALAAQVVAREAHLFGRDDTGHLDNAPGWQGWPAEPAHGAPSLGHRLLRAEVGPFRVFLLIPTAVVEPTLEQRAALGGVLRQLRSALALCLASGSGASERDATLPPPLEMLRQNQRFKLATPVEALALLRGLFDGPWSLLAHAGNGASRTLLVRRGEPGLALTRPFTTRERIATQFAIEGHSLKWIGFEMGVALSTVSLLVSSSIKKLGLRSRVELTELFGLGPAPAVSALTFQIAGCEYALLDIPLRRLTPPHCLTDAEREVVLGVLSDKSNAEIARTRRTSINTVANQLRGVYQKLGVSGRSELICAC
ncbi:MAG: helix-turn-helix transcriptional regulator [Polyangiaceae bacterium]